MIKREPILEYNNVILTDLQMYHEWARKNILDTLSLNKIKL